MNRTDWTPSNTAAVAVMSTGSLPLAQSPTSLAVAERDFTPGAEEIGVLVCESQPITAEGVKALLEETYPLRFLAGCESLGACRELTRRLKPRVVILDKALGMQAVLDWLADLRLSAHVAAPGVVVWGVAMTEAEALRFLQGGAKGIIRKTALPESLVACLQAVARGRNWMEEEVFGEASRTERSSRSDLTPREVQVMELVEHGLKNREIARELGIRPGTVKIHLKHIFEKTGVRGRYGLALTGMRQKGVISLDEQGGDEA